MVGPPPGGDTLENRPRALISQAYDALSHPRVSTTGHVAPDAPMGIALRTTGQAVPLPTWLFPGRSMWSPFSPRAPFMVAALGAP